jgi:phosphatidylserine decarboxylase
MNSFQYYDINSGLLITEHFSLMNLLLIKLQQLVYIDINAAVFKLIMSAAMYFCNRANDEFTNEYAAAVNVEKFALKNNINITDNLWNRPLCEYKSINDFFMRKYRDLHVGTSDIITPACATITLFRNINEIGCAIKGEKHNSMNCGLPNINEFEKNICLYFYLSPSDYHCFHSPIDGIIESIVDYTNLPVYSGSVKPYLLKNGPNAIVYNRRYIVTIRNGDLKLALIIIGGFLVDSIRIDNEKIKEGCRIKKGQYIGAFALGGSAILMLTNREIKLLTSIQKDIDCYSQINIPVKMMVCASLGTFT